MPELPEVELTMRVLKPLIIGQRISDFWIDWPRELKSPISLEKIRQEVEGLRIKNLSRKGKVLFVELDSPAKLSFALHFGMSGSLLFGRPEILSNFANKKYVHFIYKFESGEELWFRDIRKLGRVFYGTPRELMGNKYLKFLGPDIISISRIEFQEKLKKYRGQLKPLLMRQDIFSGLGNITVDESLWEAKINPKIAVSSLSNQGLKRLYACIQMVLRRIIKAEGNTMRDWILPDGRTGKSFFSLNVYRKHGQPCKRCKHKIERAVVGGRGTYFCPKCQR